MRRGRIRLVGIAAIVIGVLLLIPIFLAMQSSPVAPAIPSPNAYDTYIAAGESVTGRPESVDEAATEQLREFVSANQAALELLEQARQQECVVPVDLDMDVTGMQGLLDRIGSAKAGQMLVRANGILLEREGDFVAASDEYLKMIEAGKHFPNGGLLCDLVMARAFEALGLRQIQTLVDKLTPEQKQQLADKLVAIKRDKHPLEEFMQREVQLSKNQHGLLVQLSMHRLRVTELARLDAEEVAWLLSFDQVVQSLRE